MRELSRPRRGCVSSESSLETSGRAQREILLQQTLAYFLAATTGSGSNRVATRNVIILSAPWAKPVSFALRTA
jgi:hypothetical protein